MGKGGGGGRRSNVEGAEEVWLAHKRERGKEAGRLGVDSAEVSGAFT